MKGGSIMQKKENRMVAKALIAVTNSMLFVAANSRCMFIYHQPKQPEKLKKFRQF